MAPQRPTSSHRRRTPYHTSPARHREQASRRKKALIAASDLTYSRALQQAPRLFVPTTSLEFNPGNKIALIKKRRKTTFYDLPSELLIEIARYTSAPAHPKVYEVQQLPHKYDIDITFSRINRACRQAFFEYISKNLVFGQLRFYRGPDDQVTDVPLQRELLETFNCRNTQRLFAGIFSSKEDFPMSVVRVDMEEYEDCAGGTVSDVVFIVNGTNILWLCEIIQVSASRYKTVKIDCKYIGENSASLIVSTTSDLFAVLRGMKDISLTVPANSILQSRIFEMNENMKRPVLEFWEDLEQVIQHKLRMLHDNNNEDIPGDVHLLLTSVILTNGMNSIWDQHHSQTFTRSSVLLFEQLQIGLSHYLLSRPNGWGTQYHVLLSADYSSNCKLIKICFSRTQAYLRWLCVQDWSSARDWTFVSDVIRLLMSYVALRLALARMLMLEDVEQSHIPRAMGFSTRRDLMNAYVREAKCASLHYQVTANSTLKLLTQLSLNLAFHKKVSTSLNMPRFFEWLEEVGKLSKQIIDDTFDNGSVVELQNAMPRLRQIGRC